MKRYLFYTRYAMQSFRRSGARAVFAVFCVAAGVAAIVALQLVSANLRASITGDAQKITRGDIAVTAPTSGMSVQDYNRFATLKQQGAIVDYTPLVDSLIKIRPVTGDTTIVEYGAVNGVDPYKYPFYDRITADQPAGKPLSRLLSDYRNILVNQTIYDKLKLHIGSVVEVSIRSHVFIYTVAGVVPNSAVQIMPGGNPLGLSAFAMVDYRTIQPSLLAEQGWASRIYVKTRDAAQATSVKKTLQASLGKLYTIDTAADVEKQNKDAAANLDKFMTIMGLVALLIGGIGIINTMLMAARRRRKEIAVIKALGMKGSQVITTFTIGSLALGLTGGIVGVGLGIGASKIVNQVTQNLMPTVTLDWQIRPGPIIAGMVVALVGTVLFAFIPVWREGQVKPIVALRDEGFKAPAERRRERRRNLQSIPMAIGMALVMGILAGFLVDFGDAKTNVVVGAIIGFGALLVLAFLTEVFSWVIVGISKLPGMGTLTLRLAFRNLGRQKRRMASTLLALCIGILSVGSVAILAQNLKSYIGTAAARDNSYNVVVFYGLSSTDMGQVHKAVDTLPGIVTKEFAGVSGRAQLVTVDGKSAQALLNAALKKPGSHADIQQRAAAYMQGISGRDLRAAGTLTTPVEFGRTLGQQDIGTNHAVVNGFTANALSIHVGSTVGYRVEGRIVTFKIVGVQSRTGLTMDLTGLTVDNGYLQRVGGLFSADSENYSTTYLKIESRYVSQDVSMLNRAASNSFTVLDLSVITSFINTWIDKFALFPEILAALSLFAGVVIIANAVAMAMMERRREIGIMKAVGAKRRFVLQELLTENALVGFVGALAGTGLAMMATAAVDQQFLHITPAFDWLVIAGLLAMGMALAVAAALLTAWPASGEKPLRVLRYE
jgi:putative ABC transport system permease protein